MKRLSFILSFIVCICVANTNDVFSQKRELQQFKGKVTNLQGEPVRAVSIYIPGTGRYTSSDMNGDFSVEAKHKETLRFSHIGMKDVLIQLDKDFPSELLSRIPKELQEAAIEVLAQDPRAAYNKKPDYIYGMAFDTYDIRFVFQNDLLTVTDVTRRAEEGWKPVK